MIVTDNFDYILITKKDVKFAALKDNSYFCKVNDDIIL